jgi:hypothetical protein
MFLHALECSGAQFVDCIALLLLLLLLLLLHG